VWQISKSCWWCVASSGAKVISQGVDGARVGHGVTSVVQCLDKLHGPRMEWEDGRILWPDGDGGL
jgi:hypothetical protein